MARGRSSDIRMGAAQGPSGDPRERISPARPAPSGRQRRVWIYELVWVLVLGFVIDRKRTLAALRQVRARNRADHRGEQFHLALLARPRKAV